MKPCTRGTCWTGSRDRAANVLLLCALLLAVLVVCHGHALAAGPESVPPAATTAGEAVAAGDGTAGEPEHVVVYAEPRRFGGWPANHGMWSWGDELLVGFSRGHYKYLGPDRHAIDRERPEEHWLARSLDGGRTWSTENPAERGDLIPMGAALHGIEPPWLEIPQPQPCPGGIEFTHPDFALTARMSDANGGTSRFYYSYDRGRNWEGPFLLPLFEQPGIMARTDYIVLGRHDALLFLTAAKQNVQEGRPICVRTEDGGATWRLVGSIGPEPTGFAIMPSTVRVGEKSLVSAVRRREGPRRWLEAFRSDDLGQTWQLWSTPAADLGEGNPPSLVRLADGRLVVVYGYRAAPFGVRARTSDDEGRTWSDEIVLRDDSAGRDVGYPRTIVRPDGRLVSVYYITDRETDDRYIAATIWQP